MRLLFLFILLLAGWAGPSRAQESSPTLSVAVEPAGFATYPVPTQAAEIGYYLSPESALSLSYAKGTTTQLLAKYDAQLALIRYKHFFGAVSHFNFGLGYRSFESHFEVKAGAENEDVTVSSAAVVAEASFGNQVVIGPLYFGCDWIGGTAPIARLREKSNYPEEADESETEDYEQSFGEVAYKPIMQFMRVFVGAIF